MAKKRMKGILKVNFFLPSILILILAISLSIVYATISSVLNVSGDGSIEGPSDYYYKDEFFYYDEECKEKVALHSSDGYLQKLSDAVSQIHDGYMIFMMSSYETSGDETASVSGKQVNVLRHESFTNRPMIIVTGGSTLTLEVDEESTLLFTGINANVEDGQNLHEFGGTFCVASYGTLNLKGNSNKLLIIESNTVNNSGGGIYIAPDGNAVINNVKLSNNSSTNGGSVCCNGGEVTMENCCIEKSTANDAGGGIYVGESNGKGHINLTNCEIKTSNKAFNGAGVHVNNNCSARLDNCLIESNVAERAGGGINCFEDSNTIISNCTIEKNEARFGSGIDTLGETTITNCRIFNNISLDRGGVSTGIYTKLILENTDIISNVTSANGESAGSGLYQLGELILKGKVTIKDNKLDDGTTGNLYLRNYMTTKELTQGSQIGIISQDAPTIESPVIISPSGQAASTIDYFFSDSKVYEVSLNNGVLQLSIPVTDYYYKNGIFYTDEALTSEALNSSGTITKFSDAVHQIFSEKNIYMMSCYKASENESITIEKKNIFVNRHSSFVDNSMFRVSGNTKFEIKLLDSNSSITFNGNNITTSVSGGVFYVETNGNLELIGKSTVKNIIIKNNIAKYGSIFTSNSGKAVVNYVSFSNNQAQTGGAVCSDGTLEMLNCDISNGTVTNKGGAIQAGGGSGNATLTDCKILKCTAKNNGGGMNVDAGSWMNLENCEISDTKANNQGGGIFIDYNSTITLNNCKIKESKANYGGGISINGKATVTDCTISGNTAILQGGGIVCQTSDLKLQNKVTVSDNKLEDGTINNLDIRLDRTIDTNGLTGGIIGISTEANLTTSGSSVTLSLSGQAASTVDYFFSDNEDYTIRLDNNSLLLVKL